MASDAGFFNGLMHQTALIVAALILLAAAISDVKRFRIANWFCLALTALFPLYVITAPQDIAWAQHVAVAGLVLLIGFAMFAIKALGGGDVKILAAAALWAGPKLIATLLLVTTLAGGALAIIFASAALARALLKKDAIGAWHKAPVPYGVAIACGGIATILSGL